MVTIHICLVTIYTIKVFVTFYFLLIFSEIVRYITLFVLTLLALLLWPAGGVSFWHHFSDLMECGKQLISSITSRAKEKDEDLNCEYEMMWDAEGSMHLVKKALNVAITCLSETVSVERFAAVLHLHTPFIFLIGCVTIY